MTSHLPLSLPQRSECGKQQQPIKAGRNWSQHDAETKDWLARWVYLFEHPIGLPAFAEEVNRVPVVFSLSDIGYTAGYFACVVLLARAEKRNGVILFWREGPPLPHW